MRVYLELDKIIEHCSPMIVDARGACYRGMSRVATNAQRGEYFRTTTHLIRHAVLF
jgi:hypothetical protein